MPLESSKILADSDPYVHGHPQFHSGEPSSPFFLDKSSIKVHLLSEPDHAHDEERDWVYRAYQICMSTWTTREIQPADFNEMVSVLQHEYTKGLATIPLEAFHLTFAIEGIPRAVTHQVVRHRRAGFGQESLRVTDVRRHGFRIPDSVLKGPPELRQLYTDTVALTFKTYAKLVDAGIPLEDARLLIGMGLITYMTITLDLRTFIDYLAARTSEVALDEHKLVAVKMFEAFKETYPLIYSILKNKFPKNQYLIE